ncbi:MAG: phosphate signaling complex protein PhoU [Fusobacteriota bacterium]
MKKQLHDKMKDINSEVINMLKDSNRFIEIILNMLKLGEVDKKIYGEGKAIEDDLNNFEVKIDTEIVETIARYQPAAYDLRFLIGISRMTVELERIGDLCVGISRGIHRGIKSGKFEEIDGDFKRLYIMAKKVYEMYGIFLNSFLNRDIDKCYLVLSLDEEINEMQTSIIEEATNDMKKEDSKVEINVEKIIIAKNLERIADQTKNLSEDYLYIERGKDIRHAGFDKGLNNKKDDNKKEN